MTINLLAQTGGGRMLLTPSESIVGIVFGLLIGLGFLKAHRMLRAPAGEGFFKFVPVSDRSWTRGIAVAGSVAGGILTVASTVHLIINLVS